MNAKFTIICSLGLASVLIMSFTFETKQDPWAVPEKSQKMANPVKSSSESLAEGKTVWTKHCVSCHGKKGMGDGSKAAQLKTSPGDFTKDAFQKQTDGALFYKISEGRKDMPSFKKKIPDADEIWSVVNYMRTFKS